MKVVIQKTDLDTCLTAVIMGVSGNDEIIAARGRTDTADLMNPEVLCIEAGGSGLVVLNNFDHHEPGKYYPPACRQAFDARGRSDDELHRLVNYVCLVDEASKDLPSIEFPSLSSIFSGMLLTEKEPLRQFACGMSMLRTVLADRIDPFGTVPNKEEWRAYRAAKERNRAAVESALKKAETFITKSGLPAAWLESNAVGGIQELYKRGCVAVVMYNPSFGESSISKFTIAGNNIRVSRLLPLLNSLEDGWGGRDTIIGSPHKGTLLSKETVITLVKQYL